MKGWSELKDAFAAAVECDEAGRARHVAALAGIDPALARRLEALLAADRRGESLEQMFQFPHMAAERPTRIGGYDIVGVLGTGGMGEVYRALDVRLQREVAIKVLPAAMTTDPDRLARFEREAQVLAALNHRHIAQVYGLEGSAGTPALVMELVEGPTLAEVIADRARTPLTLARALTIARQIADGLDAAHEKGIVHRDLKPGNVALTTEGDVKILDFGVAKSAHRGAGGTVPAPDATDAGVVLGTPAYMSPEQARGLAVDKRTDIWSFGCTLYELLTGRQSFAGATSSDTLVAVLEREPDLTVLPEGTPAAVRALIRHCLQKDVKHRLRDIADARLVIDDVLNGEAAPGAPLDVPSADARAVTRPAVWLIAGAAIAAAATMAVMWLLREGPPVEPLQRTITSIALPRGMHLAGADLDARGSETRFAVSPDGRTLVLVAADETRRPRLWIRDLASAALHPLPDTEGAASPFWSPDGASIGFVASGKLRTIRLAGGTPVTVHESAFRTGAWGPDGRILFAPAGASPLFAVPAVGGPRAQVTALDTSTGEVQHESPAFLPDGRHFVYFSLGGTSGALEPRGISLGTLDTAAPSRLLVPRATQPRYANGHLFFVQNGTLMAQPLDVGTLTLRNSPIPVVEDVTLSTAGATGSAAAYSVSAHALAYQAAVRTESRLLWFDREGRQLAALTEPADYGDVALSPDGTRVAVSLRDPARFTRDVWILEADSGRAQRLTFDAGDEFAPVWSPDGTRLLFSAMAGGLVNLHLKDVNSDAAAVPLEVDDQGLGRYAADWSRDGRILMYIGGGRAIARSDIWVAPAAGPRQAHALLDSGFVETHARLAPSGNWFLYTSNETGQLEVYVDRFPGRGAKRLVSAGGGGWPRWARDGTEIFYLSADDRLMAAGVRLTGDALEVAAPRRLFALRPRAPSRLDAYPYDVSPDGRRFVVNTLADDTSASSITLVLNWAAGMPTR